MILVDVNIFMDIFRRRRKGWTYSLEIINRVRNRKIKGYISALTIPILWFLLSKDIPEKDAKNYVKTIIEEFEVIPLDMQIINLSFKSEMEDFEDAIQFTSAISANCKVLITRNKEDFLVAKNNIEILTPEEFLDKYG
ncbi:MAG: PIN domain-containing protein [Candidatus Wolframiiraptor sp.]|nr:MAG: PIN domain-containing protein [Candidatus Wolframiiraptor sp.]